MQESNSTSKSADEFNEYLYVKDMKDDTSINFTNTSRIGSVEDGVGQSEVSTNTAVCKKAKKALDAYKHEKDERSEIENRLKLEILKPVQPESKDPTAPTEPNKVTGKKVWLPWHESKLHTCMIGGELKVLGLNPQSHLYSGHDFMLRKEYNQKHPDADIEPRSWQCPMCTVSWTKKCTVNHLSSNHLLKDYRMAHADAGMDVDQCKCLICSTLMAHYTSPISGHLTSKHGITITEYFEEYHEHQPTKETLESIEKMKVKEEPKDEVVTPVTSTVRSMSKSTFDIKSIVRQVMGCDLTSTQAVIKDPIEVTGRSLANKTYKETGKHAWYELKSVICELCF